MRGGTTGMTAQGEIMAGAGIVLIGGLLVQHTTGVGQVLIMVVHGAQSMTSIMVNMKDNGVPPNMVDTAGEYFTISHLIHLAPKSTRGLLLICMAIPFCFSSFTSLFSYSRSPVRRSRT